MATTTTPIRVGVETHAAVQRAALVYSAQVGRRITMSQVVAAALAVAERHTDELLAALAPVGLTEGSSDE